MRLLWLRQLWKKQRGQEMIEYALLGAAVALSAGAVIPPMLPTMSGIYSKVIALLVRFGA